MNREDIAKRIKFDIANDLIVKNKDFIEADLSKVLAEIAAAEKRGFIQGFQSEKSNIDAIVKRARCEVAQKYIDHCFGNKVQKFSMDIIAANSDHIADAGEMIGGK